jgi:hypothetical protein
MRKKMHKGIRRAPQKRQKGSALLVSLMVMVGLSLLGLTFVAISETENLISVNERNKTQTSALAEAGAKVVVEWFQDPEEFEDRGILPDNLDAFKTSRTLEGYSGYYKPNNADDKLFDQPFGPKQEDLFYGDEAHADVIIEAGRNDDSDDFLELLNGYLFTSDEAGKITSIRVYAPPNVGGTLLDGFWVGGQRYGLATIYVKAEKENAKGAVIARSICRIVIAPFPLPGPTGAVQAVGTFAANGNYEVHWGAIESELTGATFIKRPLTSLPRFDPYDYAYFEYGYDSSRVWTPDTIFYEGTFPLGETVRPTDPTLAAQYEFVCVDTTGDSKTAATAAQEPDWAAHTDGAPFWDDNVQWQLRPAVTAYPIATGTGSPRAGYNNHAWLGELLESDRATDDPWFVVRARGYIDDANAPPNPDYSAAGPIVYDYAAQAGAAMATKADDFLDEDYPSHYFQYQTSDNKYIYKNVDVPGFDYDFWKAAAQAARGEEGVFYLRHVGEGKFSDELVTRTFEEWIEEEEGFMFFDSRNNTNPQDLTGITKTNALVDESVDPCGAKGMIYGNFTEFSTNGCNDDSDGYYRMPGEPYRDIGYRKVVEETSGAEEEGEFVTDASGSGYVTVDAYNGEWDYQDLPFSNGDTEKNEIFDVCVAERTFRLESGTSLTAYLPLPYYPGCTVGNNVSTPGCNCSEPHEPYLNVNYDGNPYDDPVIVEWENPASDDSATAKETDDETPFGTPVACDRSSVSTEEGQEQCATNAYDEIGGLMLLPGNSSPGVVGVIYNEGNYSSSGNASFYGSVVVAGNADPNGTQEVWFDACLVAGCWPPPDIPFPRVMITSIQIH